MAIRWICAVSSQESIVTADTILISGRPKEICHQTLNIIFVLQILKRVVAVALIHMNEIQHHHTIALSFQKTATAAQQFPFRIRDGIRAVGLKQIWHSIPTGLARTGAANDPGI